MTTMNLNPLFRSTIGFDRILDFLDSGSNPGNQAQSYPPYNIEVIDENQYQISMAVAGFSENDISLTTHEGKLIVEGKIKQDKNEKERQFLHRGIANRAFKQTFQLADHVKVTEASMNNGILTIEMLREVPEAMKPKSIKINTRQIEQA